MRMPYATTMACSLLALTTAGCAGVEIAPSRAMNEPVTNLRAAGLGAPPAGYGWYRDGAEYILAAKLSGRVLRTQPAPKELARSVDGFGYVEH